jgi:hypothetical protein
MASMPYVICMIGHRAVGELHEQKQQQGRLPRLRSMLTWSMSSRGPPDALYGYLPVAASSRVRPRLLHHPSNSVPAPSVSIHGDKRLLKDGSYLALLNVTTCHHEPGRVPAMHHTPMCVQNCMAGASSACRAHQMSAGKE